MVSKLTSLTVFISIALVLGLIVLNLQTNLFKRGPVSVAAQEVTWGPEFVQGADVSWGPELIRNVDVEWGPEISRRAAEVVAPIQRQIQRQPQRQEQVPQIVETPRLRTFESPGCNGSISVWGVWNADTGELIDIEKSFGEVPGECGNPLQATEVVRTVSEPVQQSQEEVRRISLPDSCFVCDQTFFRRTDPVNCGVNPPVCDPNRGDQPACVGAFAGQSCDLNRIRVQERVPSTSRVASCTSGVAEIDVNGDIICISNNNTNTNTNTINFSPQIVQAGTREFIREVVKDEPTVVTVASEKIISELPKTGVPLSLMLFGALVPIGLHLKRFGRAIKNGVSANSIWEQRQLKK